MEDALTSLRPAQVVATRSGYSLHCSALAHTWQIGAAANRLFRRPVDKPLGLGADYSIAATCPSGYWTRRPWTHPSIATARAPYPAPQARRSEGGRGQFQLTERA